MKNRRKILTPYGWTLVLALGALFVIGCYYMFKVVNDKAEEQRVLIYGRVMD